MKLNTLELLAFGPFTQKKLSLAESGHSLHLIYGPNEAGKSTTLRALTALLFGFEARTQDNFLHDFNSLRVGGTLVRDNGEKAQVVRRKGTKNTLLTPGGESLDENLLSPFLPGLDRELFLSHYGLDHGRLVQGGTAILESQGESNTLFGVASAFLGLKHLLENLQEEAEALFKPRGRTGPTLNTLSSRMEDLRKRQKELTYRGDQHQLQEKQLQEARESFNSLRTEQRNLTTRLNRIERLIKALPLVRQRETVLTQLANLVDARILAADFPQRRQAIFTRLSELTLQKKQLEQELERRQQLLEALTIDHTLLGMGEEISNLHAEIGKIQKNEDDLIKRRDMLSSEEHSARNVLRELGRSFDASQPDYLTEAVEQLNLPRARRDHIQTLGGAYQARLEAVKAARRQLEAHQTDERRKRELLASLPPVVDTSALQPLIAQARRAGALEDEKQKLEQELAHGLAQAQQELRRLPLWHQDLAALEQAALPLPETAARFETAFNRLETQLKSTREQSLKHRQNLLSLEQQLQTLQLTGEVPTEATLNQAREKRDRAWESLQHAWLERGLKAAEARTLVEPAVDGQRPLLQLYPALVRDADERSDRLRREADRAARLAQTLAELQRETRALEQSEQQEQQTTQAQLQLQTEWQEVWRWLALTVEQPLPTPSEMKAWLLKANRILEAGPRLEQLRQRRQLCQDRIDLHRTALLGGLEGLQKPMPGSSTGPLSLEGLLQHAERVLDDNKTLAEQHRSLQTALQELTDKLRFATRDLSDAEQALSQWRQDWAIAIQVLNLTDGASPEEANTQLRLIDALRKHYDEARALRSRIQGMDRDNRAFAQRVQRVCETLTPELLGQSVTVAARQLETRRGQESARNTEHKTLREQQEKDSRKLADLSLHLEASTRDLNQCLEEAGVSAYEQLTDVEQRSTLKLEQQRRLDHLEQQLTITAGSQTLPEWIEEVQHEDLDTLQQTRIDDSERQKTVEQQLQSVGEKIGSLQQLLSTQDGTSRASELSEESQQILSELREGTEQYLRIKLSQAMLEHAMGEWRQQHQGPLLARASELFRRLTLERYTRLQIDYDKDDRQILVALRGVSAEPVRVEGMSQGTRDQLFLALRLASLELDLRHREKVPFVIDDLLINFDDHRSEATLQILLELSRLTQVIFFTHHPHLLTLAERALPSDAAQVIRLQP